MLLIRYIKQYRSMEKAYITNKLECLAQLDALQIPYKLY